VTDQKLPAKIIAEDARTEQAAEKQNEALARLRWRWTLDESNPDRVSIRAYARDVGRADRTIGAQARGYANWSASPGARTLSEWIERAKMTGEKAEIVEAVAEANAVTFKHAASQYAPDVGRVRDAVEKAVERQPEMTADDKVAYAKHTAQTIARSKAADAKRRTERAAQRSVMFMRIDAKLAHARRDLRDVLEFGRDLGLGDDEIEDVKQALAKIKSFTDLIDMALTGSMDVDWDAELTKIGDF